ncbi:DUF1259 domain-containing protein [Streptomyces morookaense]|uniref:DUF1259 domain-containing protein n=1 Tax=Streptomyces morookaense TaxID=1970 RepID=UPI0033C55A7A
MDTSDSENVRRRPLLTAAALAPVLAGAGTAVARSGRPAVKDGAATTGRLRPVATTAEDWRGVSRALGRRGIMAGVEYQLGFLRDDLRVTSRGVSVNPALAVGSHVSFVRYDDGSTLMMGDLAVAEAELQHVVGTVHARGLQQTAIHKHLLAHSPEVWWVHVHGHRRDAEALAGGLRAVLDRTATPARARPVARVKGLDTKRIAAALGVKGFDEEGVHKCLFFRRETVTMGCLEMPPGLGAMSAFLFQPLGGGRAAVNGDFAMTADEVQDVLAALHRGGISIIELHNHGLDDEPRLFFVHFWAVGDAVHIARTLRRAVDATDVAPFEPVHPAGSR